MGGFTFGSWSILGDENQSIAAAATHPFGAINNAGKVSTEISVNVVYAGAGETAGADLIIEREYVGTPAYEATAGAPWVVPLPFLAGATYQRVITVPADMAGNFQVRVRNNQAATHACTVTVRTRQSTYSAT